MHKRTCNMNPGWCHTDGEKKYELQKKKLVRFRRNIMSGVIYLGEDEIE
jgi:hypothetical protein